MPAVPLISHSSRSFSETFSVTLLWSGEWTGRGVFLYTLNGTAPTLLSPRTTGPNSQVTILSGSTVTLRVIALDESDSSLSTEASTTYTYVNPNQAPQFDPLQPSDFDDIRTGFTVQLVHLANDDLLPTGALTYSITAGAIPTGLLLNGTTGIMDGVPTTPGLYNYTLEVTDGLATDTKAFSVLVSASTYVCPLGGPYNTFDSVRLDRLVRLSYFYVKKTSDKKAIVRVSWNREGLADIDNTVLHELYVKESGVLMPGFPKIFSGEEAFLAKYSNLVVDWDLTKEHIIEVVINCTYRKSVRIKAAPLKIEDKIPLGSSLNFNQHSASISNVDTGIKIKINSCAGDTRRLYKNIYVNKKLGAFSEGEILDLRYVRSVELPLTVGSTSVEYGNITINGSKKTSFTTNEFNSIFDDRRGILVKVDINDSSLNFLEVTDENVINNTHSTDIMEVINQVYLDPTKHNDENLLYLTLDSNKYWRFRHRPISLPFQGSITEPDSLSEWIPYHLLDPDYDNSITVPVPGYLIQPGAGAVIRAAVNNRKGDFTGFSSTSYTEADIAVKLDTDLPGVEFLKYPNHHIDTDVVDGAWYTYEVEIETWSGERLVILRKIIKREEVEVASVSESLTLESLETPARDPLSVLNESDFQSGPSKGIRVFLSDSNEDAALYKTIAAQEEGGSCGCTCEDCD